MMVRLRQLSLLFVLLLEVLLPTELFTQAELKTVGTHFYYGNQPFPYTGISFFNAIYNDEFATEGESRRIWLQKFNSYGVNVLRVWAQWDNDRGFVNTCDTCSLITADGNIRPSYLTRIKAILADMQREGMIMQLVLFSHESIHKYELLGRENAINAVRQISTELLPFRNLFFQVWNEHSADVLDHLKAIKAIDSNRLVTNSPGFAGNLGSTEQNSQLDFLTPHTSRQNVGAHWRVGPKEIAYLLERYGKPVVDDEPARNGTSNFGGPKKPTTPFDQIAQILAVWNEGGYITYHHDMFQLGSSGASTPPSGIPDPEFNPYHHQIFQLLKVKDRFMHTQTTSH